MLYTVRYGDSLNSVARAHRVSPAELSSINQLDPHIKPVPGQSLIIPDDNEPSKPIAIHGSVLPGTGDMAFLCAAPYLTYVSVRSGRFLPDGSIIGINDHSLIRRAYGFSTAPLLTVTNQRQGGEYSGELLHGLLQSEGAKAAFSDKLTAYLSCRNYKGVNLDFSSIYPEDASPYAAFAAELAGKLHDSGFVLFITVHGRPEVLRRLDSGPDRVIILPWAKDHAYGPPCPAGPMDNAEECIKAAAASIPSDRILLGIPSFGCNWALPYRGGIARPVYLCEAPTLAHSHFADIRYDEALQAPHFSYYDSAGTEHMVWFHDPRSISARLDLAEKYGLGGISWGNIAPPYRPGWTIVADRYKPDKIL